MKKNLLNYIKLSNQQRRGTRNPQPLGTRETIRERECRVYFPEGRTPPGNSDGGGEALSTSAQRGGW
jgi:hypothetical protein